MSNNQHDLYPELFIFTLVIESGSFTGAANLLGTNPPAISRAIQKLEQSLGVRLLNRTTRKVGATDEGTALYERCRSGLNQIQLALASVKESRTQPKGLLRITSSMAFGRKFIAPLAIAFQKTYRDIEIDLSLNDDFIDLIENGIDIAIRGSRPEDSRLINRTLAPIPLYVCASPSYLARHGIPAAPSALSQFRCIRFKFRSTKKLMRWEFQHDGEQFALDIDGPLCVDDIESACRAALDNEGLVQLPGYLAVEHIRSGRLRPVLLEYLDQSRAFSITYVNRREHQPLRDSLFVDFVSKELEKKELFELSSEELKIFHKSINN